MQVQKVIIHIDRHIGDIFSLDCVDGVIKQNGVFVYLCHNDDGTFCVSEGEKIICDNGKWKKYENT